MTEIVVPTLGESVAEATVAQWLKKEGDIVDVDDPLLEVTTDKVNSEIPSPVKGVLKEIRAKGKDGRVFSLKWKSKLDDKAIDKLLKEVKKTMRREYRLNPNSKLNKRELQIVETEILIRRLGKSVDYRHFTKEAKL